jgi:hypothetical protein
MIAKTISTLAVQTLATVRAQASVADGLRYHLGGALN